MSSDRQTVPWLWGKRNGRSQASQIKKPGTQALRQPPNPSTQVRKTTGECITKRHGFRAENSNFTGTRRLVMDDRLPLSPTLGDNDT